MGSGEHVRQELVTKLHEFLSDYYDDRDGGYSPLGELAQRYPKEQRSLEVKYDDLYRFDRNIADDLIHQPETIIKNLEEAVSTYPKFPGGVIPDTFEPTVRITGLDQIPSVHQFAVGDYRSKRVDERPYTVLRGQVSRTTEAKPLVQEATFECARCATLTTVPQHSFTEWEWPHECAGCDRQGPFTVVNSVDEDFQLIRLQRPPHESLGGGDPDTIDVRVTGDLVKEVAPGDKIRVGANLTKEYDDDAPVADVVADANAIETQETDFEDIDWEEDLDRIKEIEEADNTSALVIDSILPSHRGDENIKEAIALQMFGGVDKELPDGSKKRGQSHILLVGDPGVGKSDMLDYAALLSPRSVQSSGESASAAGLTCAAVQTDFGDGGWTLEGGALVEATGGLCTIDEFDKIDEDEREGANQAMSQGKITPAKAGINTTLPAKTTVLAAANPKYGRFDPHEPVGEQFDIGATMLPRFDLIFTMTDQPDIDKDAALAEHILDTHQTGGKRAAGEQVGAEEEDDPEIDKEVLRSYIAYAKETCTPVITDEAKTRLRDFYVRIRSKGMGDDTPVPVTVRKIEALVRLAESSARMRLSDEVTIEDAERVIEIVMQCLEDVGIDPETGDFDADIVETGNSKAQKDRIQDAREVIDNLELDHENGAPRDEVLEEMVDRGYTKTKVIGSIDKLKEEGKVYEPTDGFLRLT